MRLLKFLLLGVAVVYVVPVLLSALLFWTGDHPASWAAADWTSAKVLPDPAASPEAAVYVMSARTGGLKGRGRDAFLDRREGKRRPAL